MILPIYEQNNNGHNIQTNLMVSTLIALSGAHGGEVETEVVWRQLNWVWLFSLSSIPAWQVLNVHLGDSPVIKKWFVFTEKKVWATWHNLANQSIMLIVVYWINVVAQVKHFVPQTLRTGIQFWACYRGSATWKHKTLQHEINTEYIFNIIIYFV